MTLIIIFDIDGVVRDVSGSYRRAIADTVEEFTQGNYRPTSQDIDRLKSEGIWNNDWEASQELIYRYFETKGTARDSLSLDYEAIVAFFQSRYRGAHPTLLDGYITTEPLLMTPEYLEDLTANGIAWGFFSGATRVSAEYVLKQRLGLGNPVLVAMEDAPSKPDPTGLFAAIEELESEENTNPVFYVGDTVADMYTVKQAMPLQPQRPWFGIGVLPPHVQETRERQEAYAATLKEAGAKVVLNDVKALNSALVQQLLGAV